MTTERIKALEDALREQIAFHAMDLTFKRGRVEDSEIDDIEFRRDRAHAALAASQPAQPVAWGESCDGGKFFDTVSASRTKHHTIPLYSAPQPLTVQDAARVPEIAALIEAATAAKPHIRGALGFTLNAALRAIAEGN